MRNLFFFLELSPPGIVSTALDSLSFPICAYLTFGSYVYFLGAVARVSLGGSLAGLSVYLQIDACGSAAGHQKCLSDVGAGPVDVVRHVFYIGNACSRRRALGHPDFYFKPTVLQLEPLDLQQFSQQEPRVQVQVIDVPSASKPVPRRLTNDDDGEVKCAQADALETALDHLCHDARSPHKGPALSCNIASNKVFLVGSTEIGDRLTYGNEFEVAVVLDMCPEDGSDPSAAVTLFMNDQPYGTMGDKQFLTGSNKQYVLIFDSWREQGVQLQSTVDAAFEYTQQTGEIKLVVTIKDTDLAPQKIYDQIINVDLAVCKANAVTPETTTTPARRRLSISPDSWFGAICAQANKRGFYCNRKGSGDDLTMTMGRSIPVLGTSLHVETTIYSPCDPPARAEFVLTYLSQRIPLHMVTLGRTWTVPIPEFTVPVLNATASGTATIGLQGSLQSFRLELSVDFCAQLGFNKKACTQQLGLGPIKLIKHTFQLGKPLCN